jgi:NHL repeat
VNHTERTARTQSPRTGLSATLRAFLPGAKGSGAPSRTLLATPLVALAALLAPAAAQAAPPTLIPYGQFQSPSTVGVAVDNSPGPSQGDVYTAAFLAVSEGTFHFGEVNKFDSSGNLLSPPSPFGVAHELGDKGLSYSGAAVNPTNGDLYVLDAFYSEIDVFNPATGELKESFPVAASGNFEFLINWTMVGIATDSAGNLYVPVVPENEVLEYTFDSTSSEWKLEKTFTGGSGSGALKKPTGVAVDPSGNLWVADTGNQRIEQLSPAGASLSEIPVEGTLQSVAVDAHAHVFAILRNSADFCGSLEPPCLHLLEYTAAGAPLIDLGAGEFGGGANNEGARLPDMIAVNDSTGRVYISDPFNSRVLIYTPPTPPQVENELAVGITTSEAKLGALVNPGGIGTSYLFEYGTTTAYGQSAPYPAGDAGTGLKPTTVWASPSGLQPGTTYHYRVVVSNDLGEVQGEDKTFTTATPAQAACPNDQFRTGFSATLPDCRAYELLTPPNEQGAQADKGTESDPNGLKENVAAPDGNHLTFLAEDTLPGSPSGGYNYLATRGPAGWSLENLVPRQNYWRRGAFCVVRAQPQSEDLSKAIISAISGGVCGLEPELISGEPRGTLNIFLRDNTTGTYQLVNLTPAGVTPADAHLVAASHDFSHVVFREEAQLTPEALPGVDNLYEWSAGHVRLLTLLPDETPVAGTFVDISADGSHVFFNSGGNLYVRVNGSESLQLDASEASGPGGGGQFLAAGQDGSQVVFTDDAAAALTADTVPGSGTNLYFYDATAPAGQRLTDLTPAADTGAPALVRLSPDGSQLHFTADAAAALTADTVPASGTNLYRYAAGQLTDLTPAAHAEVLDARVSQDGSSVGFTAKGALAPGATQGQFNPYLWHAGATTYLSNLAGISLGASPASPDLRFYAFATSQSLTGYDNTNPETGQPVPELYLYDAATERLACASCNPSGESPTAEGAGFADIPEIGFYPRSFTDNGRLFFNSGEALLPSDTNGQYDVYEFEPAGLGTCADPGGCLFLISTGTGTRGTLFLGAGSSGDDVFIRTFQALVPRHHAESASTIYDVRVGGGFPEPTSPPPCTTAESCRPSPQPQPTIAGAPATATLSGPGNVKQPKKRHHKKHKRHHKRHAGANRGGSK